MFHDAFDLVMQSLVEMFDLQADLWDYWGVFPTFIFVFVGFTFYRLVISRFSGGFSGASDGVRALRDEVRNR